MASRRTDVKVQAKVVPAPAKKPRTAQGARVSANSVGLLIVAGIGVALLFAFASVVSFSGLYGIAPWLGLPSYLWWAFPLAVDLAIVIYKLAEVILRYDDRKKAKVKKAVLGTVLFTAISSVGNVVHVVSLNDSSPLHFWGGIAFAGLMPWAVYLAASVLTDLIVKPLRVVHEPEPEVKPVPATDISVKKRATRARPPENFSEKRPLPKSTSPQKEAAPWPT